MAGLAPGVLVGRDDELARLGGLVDELAAGRGRVVWVEGEPGIGKSALLAAGLERATRLGCELFWATAYEVGVQFPLRVLLDALRIGPRSVDAARAEIAGLLWGRGGLGVLTPGDGLAVVAEQLVAFVDRMCAGTPVVLVCDDVQWADEYSLGVWARLARLVHQLPLLLVAAARPVPHRAPVERLRRGVSGPDALVLRLGGLPAGSVAQLMGRLVGAEAGPRLRARAGQAAGNPLWVRELVEALLRERLVSVRAGVAEIGPQAAGAVAGPGSLAAAIGDRLGFLSEPTVSVLRMAAVLGVQFSAEHLAVLTGRPATELVAAVDEAVAAGVVAEAGGRLVFRHGLIHQALYEGMPAGLRSALHRQAARALAGAGVPAEQVAEQLPQVLNAADAWVVDWLAGAASGLVDRAPQVAVDLLQRVREVVQVGDRRRQVLEVHLVTALFRLGRFPEVEELAGPVLAGTADPAVAGQLTWTLGYALLVMARYEQALAVTGQALADGALDGVWTARVRALQAMILTNSGRFAKAQATAKQAEAEGGRAGDRLAVGYALHAQSMMHLRPRADPGASLATIDRALAVLGQEPEATDLRVLLLANQAVALANLGRMAEADRPLGETLALAERAGTPRRLAATRLAAGDFYFYAGRWDQALAELDAAAELLRSNPVRWVWLHGLGALIAAHSDDRAALGRHQQAVDDLTATGDLQTTTGDLCFHAGWLRMAQAVAAERDGQPETALARLRTVFDPQSTGDFSQLSESRPLWLPDLVRLALAVGDQASAQAGAQASAQACTAEARQQPRPLTVAAAQHCRGLLAGDPTLLLAAADTHHQIGYPLWRAQALEDAAVLLAARGQTEAARPAYTAAVEIYTTLGADWDLRRADARLRPLGLRRGVRGPRRRPTTGWDALTPTERRVAALVATGRANADIATELLLTRNTVQTHVSHILTKLGAHSRVEIARQAIRHDPPPNPAPTPRSPLP
jgi:DNA-binding CsgD family transcriptional regulator/tetratricopeptide (TPR) repeat protein